MDMFIGRFGPIGVPSMSHFGSRCMSNEAKKKKLQASVFGVSQVLLAGQFWQGPPA